MIGSSRPIIFQPLVAVITWLGPEETIDLHLGKTRRSDASEPMEVAFDVKQKQHIYSRHSTLCGAKSDSEDDGMRLSIAHIFSLQHRCG
jgi:hypothetical protein